VTCPKSILEDCIFLPTADGLIILATRQEVGLVDYRCADVDVISVFHYIINFVCIFKSKKKKTCENTYTVYFDVFCFQTKSDFHRWVYPLHFIFD
jgi:hypothetical protein